MAKKYDFIIDQYKDKKAATEINKMLIELEKTDPKEFYIIHGRLLALVKFKDKDPL